MTRNRTHRLRCRTATAALGALIAFVLTAAVATAGSDAPTTKANDATPTVASPPSNQSLPTIAGIAGPGQTLTAAPGSFMGAQPISYGYQFERCDAAENGANCLVIVGATSRTYTITSDDVGWDIRVVVTATNAAGTASAVSAPTAQITVRAAARPSPSGRDGRIRLANGAISVPVTSVAPPDRLVIDRVSFSNPRYSGHMVVRARFRVTDTRDHARVRGALVYAVALPYGAFRKAPEVATNRAGYADLRFVRGKSPAPERSRTVVFFLRARKPGDNPLAGVSIRRLVQLPDTGRR